MEVIVYTRHSPDCPHKDDRAWRKCRCRKWVYLPESRKRVSADTRSWGEAEKFAAKLREEADAAAIVGVKIGFAVDDFLKDKHQQNIGEDREYRLRHLLKETMLPWCEENGVRVLSELTLQKLQDFRATWEAAPGTRAKWQETLKAFCRYCCGKKWMRENPALELSRIRVHQAPTDYFPPEEFAAIMKAVDSYHQRGANVEEARARARAFILLLRWSGLRLTDAASLAKDRIRDGKLLLYTAKTKTPVYVPLPPECLQSLKEMPHKSKKFFFWTGTGTKESLRRDWSRTLSSIFKHAKLGKRAHPHMFRDTFAIEMLLAGVPLDQVSVLLGHNSIKVTMKHYSPWVKARQEQLENSVRKAWA